MVRAPSSLYLLCPSCQEETRHKILKGRYEGKKNRVLKVVAECSICSEVIEEELKEGKEIGVKLMLSHGDVTDKTDMYLDEEQVLVVGDELYTDDGIRNIITALEMGDARPSSAKVGEVDSVWAKRSEDVVVKISVNKGGKTIPKKMTLHYEEELSVGDMIMIEGREAVIHRIKTNQGPVHEGGVMAEDIVRVYAKMVRKRWA